MKEQHSPFRIVPLVDLVQLGVDGEADYFARNHQGLHVPVGAMDNQALVQAWANRKQFEA